MIKLAPRYQLLVGLALAALLAMTRGQHFASVNLPSASWAVFFLAGVLVRPKWVFPALFLEASLLDFAGSLWLGGRLYARLHRDHFSSLATLALCVMASVFVCYLFSGGGFLYFSGRYPEPTLALLVERIATYYPRYLSSLALYVGVAALLFIGLRAWSAQRGEARA